MHTRLVPTIAANWPEQCQRINGFFALPGPDASKNGATIWIHSHSTSRKRPKHVDVAKEFLAFVAYKNPMAQMQFRSSDASWSINLSKVQLYRMMSSPL
jgi:hypothetical protein